MRTWSGASAGTLFSATGRVCENCGKELRKRWLDCCVFAVCTVAFRLPSKNNTMWLLVHCVASRLLLLKKYLLWLCDNNYFEFFHVFLSFRSRNKHVCLIFFIRLLGLLVSYKCRIYPREEPGDGRRWTAIDINNKNVHTFMFRNIHFMILLYS